MGRSESRKNRLLEQRGQVTWVTLLILSSLAAAGYLAYVWVPLYFVHYEVKQVVRDYGNQAVKNPADAELVQRMVQKLQSLDTLEVVNERTGRVERRPAIDIRPQDVGWERNTSDTPPMLHVSFEYARDVTYPWINRTVEKTFQVDMLLDIGRPDWGPMR